MAGASQVRIVDRVERERELFLVREAEPRLAGRDDPEPALSVRDESPARDRHRSVLRTLDVERDGALEREGGGGAVSRDARTVLPAPGTHLHRRPDELSRVVLKREDGRERTGGLRRDTGRQEQEAGEKETGNASSRTERRHR